MPAHVIRPRPATPDDLSAIRALLHANHLPDAELDQHLDNFVVADADGRVVGCGGLKAYPEPSAGLVRSIAVDEGWRGHALGTRLTDWVLERAMSLALTQLLLFTVNARDFYLRFGFEDASLDDFPEAARHSAQYRAVHRYGREWGVIAMRRG